MLDTKHEFVFRSRVSAELVGDRDARCYTLLLEHSNQTKRGFPVCFGLDKSVENLAVRIDGSLLPVFPAVVGGDHLIEVQFVGE